MATKPQKITPRPPIVAIMGHIDHGKSTLLDYIRKTNVVATEAGGITQHISAYEAVHKNDKGEERRITFLDTPGHEAFRGMRGRGAKVADIAVLVVSAEDGVKAQTIEAHRSIKEAAVPYIVAINKIDKPNANIERTKQTLAEAEIYVEGYGGDVPWVAISAKTGQGIPDLLDVMLLLAEMGELTGDSAKNAEGVVIESRMDPKKGTTASMVITDGTITKGMFVVADGALAPVRVVENFVGKAVDGATFSSPIRITGWDKIPAVGSKVSSFTDKKSAEAAVAEYNKSSAKNAPAPVSYEGFVVIPLILRTDVAGTLEAIEHELEKLKHERIKFKLIQKGVGSISENDIKVAIGASSPIVLAFHTKADSLAQDLASRSNITIHTFDIIYKLTEWLQAEMLTRAPHIEMEEELGQFRIIRYFSQQKEKQVIGGKVLAGKITAGARFKIMRRDAYIGEGRITELQSQKIKVDEVIEGNECGLQVESKFTLAERDVLIPYITVRKQ